MDSPFGTLELPSGTVVIPERSNDSLTLRWRSAGGHVVRSEIPFVWCSEPRHRRRLFGAVRNFNLAILREEIGEQSQSAA
jgi:hypothetical protein